VFGASPTCCKVQRPEKNLLQDASNEVMMILDDTEPVKMAVGEAYADLSQVRCGSTYLTGRCNHPRTQQILCGR